MTELQDGLPPGWDCKIDMKSGRQYFMNHSTKSTTWDDPRSSRGTSIHNSGDCIAMQHGSPDLRRNSIYPSHPSPIPAFQMSGPNSPIYIPLQEMRSMSPFGIRTVKVQDSSFTSLPDPEDIVKKIASMFPNVQESHIRLLMKKYKNKETVVISALQAERHSVVTSCLPEESVVKISSMFPTVSDTHIKLLLKKYHNREAVVISALQVEKHPIMTPGPFATPPPTRNSAWQGTDSPILKSASCANSTYAGSPRIGDTHRSSPRPHPSPKLKLRYMKSIFPEAEEMIILDVLSSNENSIQKTSEALKEMGFSRKEALKINQREVDIKIQEQKQKDLEVLKLPSPVPIPQKIKTKQEKESIQKSLQDSYKDIPEHVITIALDSVQYDESRANQILQIMMQEDEKIKENTEKKNQEKDDISLKMDQLTIPTSVTSSQSRQSLKSLLKEKPENNKVPFSRVVEENNMNNFGYKSSNLCSTQGANLELARGANEKLLLEDYVKWQGPNPKFSAGSNKALARGPNSALLTKKNYTPSGPNSELRKGAKFGLAKGSIFNQFKCIVTGGPRGK